MAVPRESAHQPLASLGNDSLFLDAILGEMLQPRRDAEDVPGRSREWGRRRGAVAPTAPPLDFLDEFHDLSPVLAPSPVSASAPSETSPTSTRLLELVTSLADTLPPPSPDPCEMTRSDSWEFSSLRAPDGPVAFCDSPSTCSSFESLTRVLDGIAARGPNGCRASMFVPRPPPTEVPERPRSASPTLPTVTPAARHEEIRGCRDEAVHFDPMLLGHSSAYVHVVVFANFINTYKVRRYTWLRFNLEALQSILADIL